MVYIIAGLSVLINSYLVVKFGRAFEWSRQTAIIVWVSMFMAFSFWWMTYVLEQVWQISHSILEKLCDISLIYWGFVMHLLLLLLVLEIFRLVGLGFSGRVKELAVALVLTVGVVGYGALNALVWTSIQTFEVEVDKPNVDVSLALITDTHIGNVGITPSRIQEAIDKVNELKPDLLILGGDIIEKTPHIFNRDGYGEVFQSSQVPIYGITGNHEVYGLALKENIEIMEAAGIQILHESIVYLPELNLYLIGRRDIVEDEMSGTQRKPLAELMSGMDSEKLQVVLDHSPFKASVDESRQNGADLLLAGHTHNGQAFPLNFLVDWLYPVAKGMKIFDDTAVIVSTGYGVWGPPLRTNSTAEIVYIKVKSRK
jgi:Predicted phosphohydrolases